VTDATILVLAKEPRPGRVKTRLCPPCTPTEAATIARVALEHTLHAATAVPGTRTVLVLDGTPGPWLAPDVAVVPQVAGDLARRLAAAFAAVTGPVLLVGMDTPQVTTSGLHTLVGDLLAGDALLGLTVDGGWWTLGVRTPCRGMFAGVPMSAPDTGRRQWRRLAALGRGVTAAPPMVDVDDFASARFVADLMPGSAFADAVHHVACGVAASSR
jgi:glycosyltransferase A (GT-A) superfamily protein (DUF2064 family)